MLCPYLGARCGLVQRRVRSIRDFARRDELRRWLVSASGQRTVPQIFVNGQPLGGYTDIEALDDEGKLDPLLAEAPTPRPPPCLVRAVDDGGLTRRSGLEAGPALPPPIPPDLDPHPIPPVWTPAGPCGWTPGPLPHSVRERAHRPSDSCGLQDHASFL